MADVVPIATPTSLEDERDLRIAALADEARSVKAYLESVQARYDDIRGQLWDLVGHRGGKNAAGGFKFIEPKGRRSTDLKRLKEFWPEVYAQVVTETEPKEDAIGSLYL